jgi:hypothetical protein
LASRLPPLAYVSFPDVSSPAGSTVSPCLTESIRVFCSPSRLAPPWSSTDRVRSSSDRLDGRETCRRREKRGFLVSSKCLDSDAEIRSDRRSRGARARQSHMYGYPRCFDAVAPVGRVYRDRVAYRGSGLYPKRYARSRLRANTRFEFSTGHTLRPYDRLF